MFAFAAWSRYWMPHCFNLVFLSVSVSLQRSFRRRRIQTRFSLPKTESGSQWTQRMTNVGLESVQRWKPRQQAKFPFPLASICWCCQLRIISKFLSLQITDSFSVAGLETWTIPTQCVLWTIWAWCCWSKLCFYFCRRLETQWRQRHRFDRNRRGRRLHDIFFPSHSSIVFFHRFC